MDKMNEALRERKVKTRKLLVAVVGVISTTLLRLKLFH